MMARTPREVPFFLLDTAGRFFFLQEGSLNRNEDTILVIDDEIGPRESLRMMFKDTHKVLLAASGQEGADILRNHTVDIVILDLKMPDADGIETLKMIRSIDTELPVFILSGYGTIDTARAAMHLGAMEFLSKPFDVEELRVLVLSAISRHKKEKNLRRLNEKVSCLNRMLHDRVEHLENLAAVGQLSADLIDEISNPLTVIQGYTDLLKEELSGYGKKEQGAQLRYFQLIEEEIERCQKFIENIVHFSHPRRVFQKVDIPLLLRKSIIFLSASDIAGRIKFIEEIEQDFLIVQGDPDLLHQVFTTILLNAVQATHGIGTISIGVRKVEGKIEVECADTGDCFSDADFSSLFSSNLAFTGTRAVTGLSVVKKIVEMHKGSISGAQKSGKTIFIIKFPACDEKKKE